MSIEELEAAQQAAAQQVSHLWHTCMLGCGKHCSVSRQLCNRLYPET